MLTAVERNELLDLAIEDLRRHAAYFARRYRLDVDDVFGETAMLFLRYAHRHDPARGTVNKFARLTACTAARCVGKRVWRHRRRETLGLDLDEAHRAAVKECRPSAVDGERVRAAVDALNPGQRATVRAWFGFDGNPGTSLSVLAAERGVSKQAVHSVAERAFAHLRKSLDGVLPAAAG